MVLPSKHIYLVKNYHRIDTTPRKCYDLKCYNQSQENKQKHTFYSYHHTSSVTYSSDQLPFHSFVPQGLLSLISWRRFLPTAALIPLLTLMSLTAVTPYP